MTNNDEVLISKKVGHERCILTLFVTTYSTSSHRAIRNLRQLVKEHFQGIYKLKIIDIIKYPNWVIKQNIVGVPMLIKDKTDSSKRFNRRYVQST